MTESITLRIRGYLPFRAKLLSDGSPVTYEVTGPSAGTVDPQRVADALVIIYGARGRSMQDIALMQCRYTSRPFVTVTLQERISGANEVC